MADAIFIFRSGSGYKVGVCFGEGTRYPFVGNERHCKWGYTAIAYVHKLERDYPEAIIRASCKKLIEQLERENKPEAGA